MVLVGYVLMCLIFGTTFLAIKVGIDAGSLPFLSAGIRFMAAGLILLIVMVWRGKAKLSLLWRKELLLTGAGLTFGTFSTLYWAEQHVASGLAAVLSATGPLMILLLQSLLLRQRIAPKAAAGCLAGFGGVILLMLPGLKLDVSLLWMAGCLAVLLGECCYASGAVYSKQVFRRLPDASPIALNAAQMTVGGVLLTVLSLFTERPDLSAYLTPGGAGSLIYLTVAGSMVGHTLFYWLVSKTNPVLPSTWLYISPLIAMGLGSLLYEEPLSWMSAAGAGAILAGIVLVNADALRQLVAGRRKQAGLLPRSRTGRSAT